MMLQITALEYDLFNLFDWSENQGQRVRRDVTTNQLVKPGVGRPIYLQVAVPIYNTWPCSCVRSASDGIFFGSPSQLYLPKIEKGMTM